MAEVAESAAAQADSPHDELLEKYQVATDPDGITEWSPKWIGWLPGVPSMRVTVGEAEMLSDLQDHQGLKGVKAAYDIYKEALHQSESAFGGEGGTDGHADAFRHAYWNAMLTQRTVIPHRCLVEQAVRDGEMVVIGTDERLDHSNPGDPDAYPERGY